MRDGHIVPLDIELKGNSRAIGLTYRTSWRPTGTQARFIDLLRAMAAAVQDGSVQQPPAE